MNSTQNQEFRLFGVWLEFRKIHGKAFQSAFFWVAPNVGTNQQRGGICCQHLEQRPSILDPIGISCILTSQEVNSRNEFCMKLTCFEQRWAFCFVSIWHAKSHEASITEFYVDFGGACPLWGLLPAWRTPNWGHLVAPVLGPLSFSVIAQARFFESPCPGRPHFGVRLADPETGP